MSYRTRQVAFCVWGGGVYVHVCWCVSMCVCGCMCLCMHVYGFSCQGHHNSEKNASSNLDQVILIVIYYFLLDTKYIHNTIPFKYVYNRHPLIWSSDKVRHKILGSLQKINYKKNIFVLFCLQSFQECNFTLIHYSISEINERSKYYPVFISPP